MQSEYIIEMLGIRKEFPGIVANGDSATDEDRIAAFELACQNGAEIVVAAGFLQEAALKAAAAEDKNVVGVDVDQSSQSPTVITSAMKGLADATQWALAKHYDNKWSEIGGIATSLGAKENAVGLPVATWSLKNWKVADYEALLAKIVSGEVKVSNELVLAPESTANVTVTYVE